MIPKLPFENIAHLGWAVKDMDQTIKTFELMGLGPWRRYTLGEPDGIHDFAGFDYDGGGMENRCKIAMAKWGAIVIELFEPIQWPIVERFLSDHGEGIWHFGYSLGREQFDATVTEMEKIGVNIVGRSEYRNGVRMAFLDPSQTGGIIFQLHDCPPEMEGFLDTMGIRL